MTTIKYFVLPEYQCSPIWVETAGARRNVEIAELPVSDGLKVRLIDWDEAFQATYNPTNPVSSGYTDYHAANRFLDEGEDLANAIQAELRDSTVVYQRVDVMAL